jgi:tetratricopeptide (TPR) repeat protein
MVGLGNLYFDAGRWTEARLWYERAIEIEGGDPNVLTDLAVVYRNLQQPERSLALLDQAIAISPGHWQAVYNKVVVLHFDLHRHDEAAAALARLKEIKSSNPEVPDLSTIEAEVMGS